MDADPRFNVKFNFKQLCAFIEVYRSGHLAAAADKLALTPSAVSVLITKLEAAAGGKLFDRTAGGLQPTAMAHKTAPHAERILAEVSLLDQLFQQNSPRRHADRIRFAATQAIASILMPTVISRFNEQHPGIQVVMHDCGSEQIGALVGDGQVDFGLGSFESDSSILSIDVILSDSISAIFPDTSPLAAFETVSWQQVGAYPLIMSRHGGDGGVRQLVDKALAVNGLKLAMAHEASSMSTALNMASHGLGIAIYPPLLMPFLDMPHLIARKLVDPEVKRHMAVVCRKGHALAPAAIRFIEVLKQTLAVAARPT